MKAENQQNSIPNKKSKKKKTKICVSFQKNLVILQPVFEQSM